MTTPGASSPTVLSPDERRWLHDKYERLSEEEGQLAGSRTYYFAVISSVLFTGLVVLIANVLHDRPIFALGVTFLGGFGILTSVIWTVLVHRTSDAQAMWREAALRLEEVAPPIPTAVPGSIALHAKTSVEVDLGRPFHVHRERFSSDSPTSWLDRRNPSTLVQMLPMSLVGFWAAVVVIALLWYLIG